MTIPTPLPGHRFRTSFEFTNEEERTILKLLGKLPDLQLSVETFCTDYIKKTFMMRVRISASNAPNGRVFTMVHGISIIDCNNKLSNSYQHHFINDYGNVVYYVDIPPSTAFNKNMSNITTGTIEAAMYFTLCFNHIYSEKVH